MDMLKLHLAQAKAAALAQFEELQAMHLADRDRILRELAQ